MHFAFTEEQEELRQTARSFLAEHSGPEQVRAAMESELGFDAELWKRIGADLGWTAVAVPEDFGGLGLGMVELVALMEVMGEALVCAPYLSSVCLGGDAILGAGSDEQKQELLPGIASGETRAALAAFESDGRPEPEDIRATFRRQGADFLLSGVKRFVVDGHSADLLVVAARQEGTAGPEGVSLFAVPAGAAGVERRRLPTMDRTRRLAEVALRDARVPGEALLGAEGRAWPALERTLRRAAVALAAEQVGGAQRSLDMAVDYAQERIQFGRPIGSFQAIKHKCADMMVRVESARSAVYYAACVAAEDGSALPEAAAMARAVACDAFLACAGDAIQIFGGVGFTWEYDVHLYFKRARSSASLLGDAAWHRERVARRIGL